MRTTVAAAGEPLLVEVDGRAGSVSDVGKPGMLPRGHLTSAQVRDGAVRGLDLHLTRLAEAHEQLFGSVLDTAAVRLLMARAVREHPDAYLRVTVDETPSGAPRVVTVVRPPLEAPTAPQSVAPTAHVVFPRIFVESSSALSPVESSLPPSCASDTPHAVIRATALQSIRFMSDAIATLVPAVSGSKSAFFLVNPQWRSGRALPDVSSQRTALRARPETRASAPASLRAAPAHRRSPDSRARRGRRPVASSKWRDRPSAASAACPA